MRFLPLLLTCAALPFAAFAQDASGPDVATATAPQVEATAQNADAASAPKPMVWPAPPASAPAEAAPSPALPQPAPLAEPQTEGGPFNHTAVWGGEGLDQCMVRPWLDAFGDCLASLGAGEEAVRFADALKADPAIGMSGVMRAFFETGDVDVALVDFPALANSNRQVVFLNGTPPIVLAESFETTPPATRAVAELHAAHPAAMTAGPRDYLTMRAMADGTQRFVLRDRVTDACRACPELAIEVIFADFKDGVLENVSVGAWLPADLDTENLGPDIANGDLTALQAQLILHGYDVGGLDGIDGPMTQAAQSAFLSEHCLEGAAGAPLSDAARAVLVDGGVGRCP